MSQLTAFGEFLARIKLRKVKLGPFEWDINETPASTVSAHAERRKIENAPDPVEAGIKTLDEMIYRIERFDADAGGAYYIGATLIQCESYLDDNGIVGSPLDLVRELMDAIDDETSNFIGGVAPYVPLGKLNQLKRALKQIRAEIQVSEDEDAGGPKRGNQHRRSSRNNDMHGRTACDVFRNGESNLRPP